MFDLFCVSIIIFVVTDASLGDRGSLTVTFCFYPQKKHRRAFFLKNLVCLRACYLLTSPKRV